MSDDIINTEFTDFTDKTQADMEEAMAAPNPVESCPEGYSVVSDGIRQIKDWRVHMQMELIRLGSDISSDDDLINAKNHLLAIGTELLDAVKLVKSLEQSVAFTSRQIGGIIANNERLLAFFAPESTKGSAALANFVALGMEKGGAVWTPMKEKLAGKGIEVPESVGPVCDLAQVQGMVDAQIRKQIDIAAKELQGQISQASDDFQQLLDKEFERRTEALKQPEDVSKMIDERMAQKLQECHFATEHQLEELKNTENAQDDPEALVKKIEEVVEARLGGKLEAFNPEEMTKTVEAKLGEGLTKTVEKLVDTKLAKQDAKAEIEAMAGELNKLIEAKNFDIDTRIQALADKLDKAILEQHSIDFDAKINAIFAQKMATLQQAPQKETPQQEVPQKAPADPLQAAYNNQVQESKAPEPLAQPTMLLQDFTKQSQAQQAAAQPAAQPAQPAAQPIQADGGDEDGLIEI